MAPAKATGLGAFVAPVDLALSLAAVRPTHAILTGGVVTFLDIAPLASAVANAESKTHGVFLAFRLRTTEATTMSNATSASLRALSAVFNTTELGVAIAFCHVGLHLATYLSWLRIHGTCH